MTYLERFLERKRLFGKVCESLGEHGNNTTLPAPLGWDYIRGYYPNRIGKVDNPPLPHERKVSPSLLRRFEY